MSNYKKAEYYLARFHSLSNAAEFIRSHGEEGFSFEDEDFNNAYMMANKTLSKQLNERADKFYKKYLALGIEIEAQIDENY